MKQQYVTYRKPAILLLLITCTYLCRAQTADTAYYNPGKAYSWVSVDMGYGYPGVYRGGAINVMVNQYIYILKTSLNKEAIGHSVPSFVVDEHALMMGRKLSRNPFGNYILSAGIAIDKFAFRGDATVANPVNFYDYGPVYTTRLGIPVEIKYFNNYLLGGLTGFSAAASVNINTRRPFFNFTLGWAVGRSRERVSNSQ
jgi:hypothetical protein